MIETASHSQELARTIETSPLPQGLDLELLRTMLLTREVEARGSRPGGTPLPCPLRCRSGAGIVAAAAALAEGDRLCASAAYAGAHLARGRKPSRAAALPSTSDCLSLATGMALGTQLARGAAVTLATLPAPRIASQRAADCLGLAVARALPLVVVADEDVDEGGTIEKVLPVAASVDLEVELLGGPEPETAYAAADGAIARARGGGGPKLILMPSASAVEEGPGWGQDSRPTDPLTAYVRRLMAHGYSRERLQELRRRAETEARTG